MPATTVTVVDGNTVSAPEIGAAAPSYFNGGIMEWEFSDGITEYAFIQTTSSDSAQLIGTTRGMDLGTNFIFYPGCNRTAEVCDATFNNLPNFGGFKMTGKSPFDGTPIF